MLMSHNGNRQYTLKNRRNIKPVYELGCNVKSIIL